MAGSFHPSPRSSRRSLTGIVNASSMDATLRGTSRIPPADRRHLWTTWPRAHPVDPCWPSRRGGWGNPRTFQAVDGPKCLGIPGKPGIPSEFPGRGRSAALVGHGGGGLGGGVGVEVLAALDQRGEGVVELV